MVLHPLDNPPPGVLVLSEDLRVVRGHLHGSLSQIIDCADERLGSGVVFVVLPIVHRLPQPVVAHLDDGEELRGLLCQQVVQLSVATNPGELGLHKFLSLLLPVLPVILQGKEPPSQPGLDVFVDLL